MSHALKNKLQLRADILSKIRAFFAKKNVLEVETPLMAKAAITDPFINPLSLSHQNQIYYLQTSPEYAMKKLLSAGSGCIYQICKAFRDDEQGRLHRPEFTMIEWYRIGFNHHDLMDEMDEFLQVVINTKPATRYSYQNLFEKHMGFNPHKVELEQLKKYININNSTLDKDDYLNLIMTHHIEPKLKDVVFIYDFPASQAALARINGQAGERFEVYINGIELANGYHELKDAKEQEKRFEQDLEKRRRLNLPELPMDTELLLALEKNFPNCAGVALGIDRLLMIAAQQENLGDVLAL